MRSCSVTDIDPSHMILSKGLPAVDDYWSIACLLLHPCDTFHHVKKPDTIKRN